MFIDGYLALCSAVGAGTATELTVAGYARQPIAFGESVDGVTVSTVPCSFGIGLRAGPVGRAIFDAPTGGNLLLVLPHPTPYATGRLPWDVGDLGHLRLFFTALQSTRRGGAYTGRNPGEGDGWLVLRHIRRSDMADLSQVSGHARPQINIGTMTAGVALSVNRGVLQAAALVPAGSK